MLVPHHLNPPISGKGYTFPPPPPPISGIGYHWQLQKHPLSFFLGRSPRDYGQKIPPFPENMGIYACGPLMHSGGRLKGPGSSRSFGWSLVLSDLIFKHSDTKWDFKNIVGRVLGGACCAPFKSAISGLKLTAQCMVWKSDYQPQVPFFGDSPTTRLPSVQFKLQSMARMDFEHNHIHSLS